MTSNLRVFLQALAGLTVVLAIMAFLAGHWFPTVVNTWLFLAMLLFLTLATFTVHLVLLKVSEDKPQKFVRVFMIATMLKLLFYLVFIFAGAYLFRTYAGSLLIGFLVFYLCFTALEVFFLRRHLDSQ